MIWGDMTKAVGTKLDPATRERLDRVVVERGVRISKILRDGLDRELQRLERGQENVRES